MPWNMKQSLHWKVENLSSPSAFDLPLGASVLIVPALSSPASLVVYLLHSGRASQVKCIANHPRMCSLAPCLPTAVYPVPFSDVSLVAVRQQMSTPSYFSCVAPPRVISAHYSVTRQSPPYPRPLITQSDPTLRLLAT